MRNIISMLLVSLAFLSCSDKNEEVTPKVICGVPPYKVIFKINTKAEKYKDFINKEGEFDTKNVYLYHKTDDNHEERINETWQRENVTEGEKDKEYFYGVISQSKIEPLFTGKNKLLYLSNNGEKVTISFKGTKSKNTKCGGSIFKLEEAIVNSEKLKIEKDNWRTDIINLIE